MSIVNQVETALRAKPPSFAVAAKKPPRAIAETLALALGEGRAVPEDGSKGDYAKELADYIEAHHPRVLADSADPGARDRARRAETRDMMRARPLWIEAMRTVYVSALALVGVSAPERMDRPEKDDAGSEGPDDAHA
ncbi:hypothetical protein BH09MYX1_BH09MYX1_40880 [soil metagenome]